jgi:hypothetical protein
MHREWRLHKPHIEFSGVCLCRGPLSLRDSAQGIFPDHVSRQHIHERAATRAAVRNVRYDKS